jgi:hypothetical protein
MDESEIKKRLSQNAERIINDPAYKKAISLIRDACYINIETSTFDQKEEREDLYYMLRCIGVFENAFKKIIRDGAVPDDVPLPKKIIR